MVFQKGNIPWNKGKTSWMKGTSMPEETKKKISASQRGKVPWNKGVTGYNTKPCSEELKRFLRKLHKGNKYNTGRVHSDDTKKKISESNKGKPKTAEHKQKLSKARKGMKASEETKQKMRASAPKGKDSPHWKGGIAFLPYCDKFNNNLKERIRERDNRTCQLCGADEDGEKLSVHHIHYDKKNCEPDLISLCRQCHSKVNHNRDYYEEFFMNKLTQRGILNTNGTKEVGASYFTTVW